MLNYLELFQKCYHKGAVAFVFKNRRKYKFINSEIFVKKALLKIIKD